MPLFQIISLPVAKRIAYVSISGLLLAGCQSSVVGIPSFNPPTSTEAATGCTANGTTTSTASFSFGGTGGCVTEITANHENAANQIRLSAAYQAKVVANYGAGFGFNSFSLAAGRIEYAHAIDITGQGKIIAIRDQGYDTSHQELSDKTIYYSGGTTKDTIAFSSHGTAVAGLAAGSDTYIGAAPDAMLLLSSWNDESDASSVLTAEANGAIVQNNSWGYVCDGDAFDECGVNDYGANILSSSYRTALRNYAGDEGIVVFSASNRENQTQATIMAALPVLMPELEEGWLSVINVARRYDATYDDQFRDRASDISLISSGCLEAARWCIAADGTARVAVAGDPDGYTIGSGTSYAAPRVSGAIALLSQAFPTLSAKELRNRLLVTADNDFFASDTENTSTMTFAEGITHDYHWIYGHGFLDVRAALLPIGSISARAKDGKSISMDQPLLVSGQATGDAVQATLSDVSIYAKDIMGGGFAVKAAPLATTLSKTPTPLWQDPELRSRSVSSFDNANGQTIPVLANLPANLDLLIPVTPDGDVGARLSTATQFASGDISLGVSQIAKGRNDMGLSMVGGEAVTANQIALEMGWQGALGNGMQIGLLGLAGVSRNPDSAFLSNMDSIRYSALTVNVTQKNVLTRGDRLNLFARQPVAVTSGSAVFSIETADDSGKATLSDIALDFAPSDREVEIGFDYETHGNYGETWRFAASRSFNAGNVSGASAIDLGATLSLSF